MNNQTINNQSNFTFFSTVIDELVQQALFDHDKKTEITPLFKIYALGLTQDDRINLCFPPYNPVWSGTKDNLEVLRKASVTILNVCKRVSKNLNKELKFSNKAQNEIEHAEDILRICNEKFDFKIHNNNNEEMQK